MKKRIIFLGFLLGLVVVAIGTFPGIKSDVNVELSPGGIGSLNDINENNHEKISYNKIYSSRDEVDYPEYISDDNYYGVFDNPSEIGDQIIIKFNSNPQIVNGETKFNSVNQILSNHEGYEILDEENFEYSIFKNDITEELIDGLKNDPNVVFIEPNYVYSSFYVPNDPLIGDQWGVADIDSIQGWDIERGSEEIVIAVIDSGIDYNHPDLRDKLWINEEEDINDNGIVDESDFNGIDDDGNGFIDDIRGWDFIGRSYSQPVEDNDPFDEFWHGTHVSGIAAATTDNLLGITGICHNCKIMPVKALDASGTGINSKFIRAVDYARNNGAHVISISWGGYTRSEILESAFDRAFDDGLVIVAASGNDNWNVKGYPAAFDNIIAVSALTTHNRKASFSNYGLWIDISAPGNSILSTDYNNENYRYADGTSMAAPFVAGVAGLLKSQNPEWNNKLIMGQIVSAIESISDAEPEFQKYNELGYGKLNMFESLEKEPRYRISFVDEENTEIVPGDNFNLNVELRNSWNNVYNVNGVLSTENELVSIEGGGNYGNIGAWEYRSGDFELRANDEFPQGDYYVDFNIVLNGKKSGGAAPIHDTPSIGLDSGSVRVSEKFRMFTGKDWIDEGLNLEDPGEWPPFLRSVAVDNLGQVYAAQDLWNGYPVMDEKTGLYRGIRNEEGVLEWYKYEPGTLTGGNNFPFPYRSGRVWTTVDGKVFARIGVSNFYDEDIINYLYRSEDSGENWINLGLTSEIFDEPHRSVELIREIEYSESEPDVMYALIYASNGDGLYRKYILHKSFDAGYSWERLDEFRDANIFDLTVDPLNSDNVFVSGLKFSDDVLLKSIDGGQTFETIIIPDLDLYPIVEIVVFGDSYYLIVQNSGLYISHDGGETWSLNSEGLEKVVGLGISDSPPIVKDLVLDVYSPNILYTTFFGSGTYKSVDKGESWFSLNLDNDYGTMPMYGEQIALDLTNTGQVYMGDAITGMFSRVSHSISCMDSDYGINYGLWGETCNGEECDSDVCVDGMRLNEYYCLDGYTKSQEIFDCTVRCVEGEGRCYLSENECADGIDNDGDGLFDLSDEGCVDEFDNDETNCGDLICEGGETRSTCAEDCGPPECNDGIDNDGDGLVDLEDLGCENINDDDETNCGDLICEMEESYESCSEDCDSECEDGIDNDGDGNVDLEDLGCENVDDNEESNCGDGVCEGGETPLTCREDCFVDNICTVDELNLVREDLTAEYTLICDINLEGVEFEPIGTQENPFVGVFDGNGHVISNYEYISIDDSVGLFGVNRGLIKNLGIENVNVVGGRNVGGLVGISLTGGEVVETYVTGSVSGDLNVGGLIGRTLFADVRDSYSQADVISNGRAGGLIGDSGGSVSNSYSYGIVEGEGNTFGGLIGIGYPPEVVDSYWDVETSGQEESDGGEGKTTEEMNMESTYEDWNFDSIWSINEGIDYPWLRN